MNCKSLTIVFIVLFQQLTVSQIILNKTIPTVANVDQIGCFDETVVYSMGSTTYACNYGQTPPQIYYQYPSNDISFVYPVGHDTLSVLSWGGTTALFYGNTDSVFNSTYSYPVSFPVRSMAVNGDIFNGQLGDTIYTINSYNASNDEWNVLRMSAGSAITLGGNFIDAELVNYIDLDYLQYGTDRYIAIVKPNDLMLYNLATNEYLSTGIANITSFQYHDGGGYAFYSIANNIYRIESIVGNLITSTTVATIPAGNAINEIALSQNASTIWVASNDGVYSNHSSAVGMEELKNLTKVYPNPTGEFLTINSSEIIDQIEVIDNFGRVLYTQKDVNDHSYKLNFSTLSVGYYQVKIISGNKAECQTIMKY